MVAAGRDAKEIDHRYLVLERLAQPAIVSSLRIFPHECVIHRLVALENLAVNLALIVVPDLAARSREYGLDRKQESHLLRLENAALRIDERDALAVENKTGLKLVCGKLIVHFVQPSNMLESRHALGIRAESRVFRAAGLASDP